MLLFEHVPLISTLKPPSVGVLMHWRLIIGVGLLGDGGVGDDVGLGLPGDEGDEGDEVGVGDGDGDGDGVGVGVGDSTGRRIIKLVCESSMDTQWSPLAVEGIVIVISNVPCEFATVDPRGVVMLH